MGGRETGVRQERKGRRGEGLKGAEGKRELLKEVYGKISYGLRELFMFASIVVEGDFKLM